MLPKDFFEEEVSAYSVKQKAAAEFIYLVNRLWIEKTVELILFRHPLLDKQSSLVLNLHKEARRFTEREINILDTLRVAQAICKIDLPPARIDAGKLAFQALEEGIKSEDYDSFIAGKLANAGKAKDFPPRDVILYGFGRIGRLLARELVATAGAGRQLRLRAIVTRDAIDENLLQKRASLLQYDSIHGDFKGSVEIDPEHNSLIVNGIRIYFISAAQPDDIDYSKYGIHNALVIDNTGAFRNREALSRHLKSKDVDCVLLTAPGKGVPNIVYGVNHEDYLPNGENVYSAASCTTNAIAPVLKVIQETLGINKGHIETIHAYTNDQNLVDNMHKKYRRGRAAALNMVITETGAGSAVARAIPELEGKLTSSAIRVPVPNGSLAILNLEVTQPTNLAGLKAILKEASLNGPLVEQIKYSLNNELVSSDIVGNNTTAIVDVPATIVSADGKSINLYVWYDNEYGYTQQVMRLARHIVGVRRFTYY